MNCPCAKVFASGENACTAQMRRPAVRGPMAAVLKLFTQSIKMTTQKGVVIFMGTVGN